MRTFASTAALAICTATLAAPLATANATTSPTTADDLTTTTPIEHVVVVFQENASFDHYFGTYPIAANPADEPTFVGADKTPEVNNLLPTSLNGFRDLRVTNPNLANPFRLSRSQFVTCSQDHGYKPEQRAANGGLMNRFVQATNKEPQSCLAALPRPVPSPQVMGYYDGNTVTALWNYAQHFALNDHAFATTYGPSTPGALNLVAGRTSGAAGNNPATVTEGVVYGDPDPLYDVCSDTTKTAQLTGPNVGNVLTDAGVSWGWFQGGFRLDPMSDPEQACEHTTTNLAGIAETDYESHHNPFQYFASTANEAHLPPSSPAAIGHDDQANHLYDLEDFWTAASSGHLPGVSFLKAAGYQDGHPGPQNSNPLNEQDFLVDTLNRLQQLPEWSSTAVILAWDDSDGWYDHQFPPNRHHSANLDKDALYGTTAGTLCLGPLDSPPDPSTVFEMRCGFGERLPFLIVSPYVKPNSVSHTDIDQSSILRFIEDNWGLGRLGHGSFDDEADPLLSMFDFTTHRDDTLLLNPFTGNADRPPSIDAIGLTPDEPTTADVLTATVAASDPDHDPTNPGRADSVHLSYEWFNGDTRLAADGPTLDLSLPGNGDRDETITVRVTADDGLETTTSSTSTTVADSPPTISLSSDRASVVYSDQLVPIAVTAADPDADGLTVEAAGLPDGLTMSQTDEGWTIAGIDQAPAGVYDVTIRASAGDLDAKESLRITVSSERAGVGYTGNLLFSTGSATAATAPVTLRAHVTQEQDGTLGDVTRAKVLFDLYASGNTSGVPNATYGAFPSAAGDATVDVGPLGTGIWTVVVRTDPATGYFDAPTSDVVPLTVYAPTSDSFVTGGGWVHDPGYLDRPVPISTDDQADFGLEARLRKDGSPSGSASYVFVGADGHQYVVRSTGWQGGGLAITASSATVAGTCDVTVFDQAGEVVAETSDNTFRMDVTDNGKSDTFALSVYTRDGALYHRVGTPREQLALGGGGVLVHR